MRLHLLASSALALAAAPAFAANIVVNPSFEDPVVVQSGFTTFFAGSTAITGWTVTAPAANLGIDLVNAPNTGSALWAYDANQSIDLAGSPGRGGIEQTLTTIAGQQYTLAFALSSNAGPHTNGVSIFWDGNFVSTESSPAFGTWTVLSFSVTATTTSTLLSFVGNLDGLAGTLLDAVSVDAVPAPGAGALALLGLAAMNRRRRA